MEFTSILVPGVFLSYISHFLILFAMAKQEETSSKCSSGTNFGIDPNKRYMKKGDIISSVGKN